MVAFLTALFGILSRIGQYFAQKQLIDAGKAEQQVQEQAKVEDHVQQAHDAVTIPDAPRTERLRNRFDAATNGE